MKKVLVFILVLLFVLSGIALAENALLGRWEGTGSVYSGMNMDPMGEWVEFKEDMTGTLFMLKEFPFTYTVEGDSVHIVQEYGLTFDGKLVGDELILDNGIEYHFARNGVAPAADNTTAAVAQESFSYEAIYCRIDDEPADLSNERVVFDSDGTGVFYMDDTEITFAWEWQSDSTISFVDDFDNYFLGTAVDDLFIGVYYVELDNGPHEFAYIFRNATENGASMAPALPLGAEIPSQGKTYKAVCCVSGGEYWKCAGDGLKLNADGSGTISYIGKDYDINWTQNGVDFSFTDQSGDGFEGIAVGDAIRGVYTINFSDGSVEAYEYIFNAVPEN